MTLSNFGQNFPTAAKLSNFSETFKLKKKTFQLRSVLSNFALFFPTSVGSFQLRSVLSNFAGFFPTSAQLSNFKLSNLKLSNFSFFPTALSNYTYPVATMNVTANRSPYIEWVLTLNMNSFLILIGKVLAVTSPIRLIVRRSIAVKCCKLTSEWSSRIFSPFIWMGSLKIGEIVWRSFKNARYFTGWSPFILDRTRPRQNEIPGPNRTGPGSLRRLVL